LKNPESTRLTETQTMIRDMARQQVAEGIRPTEVAEIVLEAIRDDRFYILTHPRYEKLIRRRMERILEGKNPTFEPG
jgi:hypothetical protein